MFFPLNQDKICVRVCDTVQNEIFFNTTIISLNTRVSRKILIPSNGPLAILYTKQKQLLAVLLTELETYQYLT